MNVNPYESPRICDVHLHKMPIWLKRMLKTCAIIGGTFAMYDGIYLHRLQKDPSGQFNEWKIQEILRYWAEQEVFGPPTEEE